MKTAADQTTQLAEVLYLKKKLEGAQIPEGLKEKIDVMLKRLRRMARQGQSSGEYESVAKYIDWSLSVPWSKYTQDNLDLANAKQVMDQMHYSHENVKQVILEYLAILNRKTQLGDTEYTSPVLAFVGVQGGGKTSLAKAIAHALGRSFTRISLGAVGSSSELRGVPYEDVSGEPGQVVKAMVRSQAMNPVILLDEFDKVSGSEAARKDFMAIMLELLDPQQNKTFRDHYVDFPVDLSKVLFIATANSFKPLSRELLDRLEIIQFEDYTLDEKVVIAKQFLFPQVLEYAGLKPEEMQITDEAWPILVRSYGQDMGVRRLERNLQKLSRGILKRIIQGEISNQVIDANNAGEFAEDKLPEIAEIQDIDYTARGSTDFDAQKVSPEPQT